MQSLSCCVLSKPHHTTYGHRHMPQIYPACILSRGVSLNQLLRIDTKPVCVCLRIFGRQILFVYFGGCGGLGLDIGWVLECGKTNTLEHTNTGLCLCTQDLWDVAMAIRGWCGLFSQYTERKRLHSSLVSHFGCIGWGWYLVGKTKILEPTRFLCQF